MSRCKLPQAWLSAISSLAHSSGAADSSFAIPSDDQMSLTDTTRETNTSAGSPMHDLIPANIFSANTTCCKWLHNCTNPASGHVQNSRCT